MFGVLEAQCGRAQIALGYLTRALALRPQDSGLLNSGGNALRALGDVEALLASFTVAIADAPKATDSYFDRGTTLAGLGRNDAALQYLERAVAPDDAQAQFASGFVYGNLELHDRALDCSGRAIRVAPAWSAAHLHRTRSRRWASSLRPLKASRRQSRPTRRSPTPTRIAAYCSPEMGRSGPRSPTSRRQSARALVSLRPWATGRSGCCRSADRPKRAIDWKQARYFSARTGPALQARECTRCVRPGGGGARRPRRGHPLAPGAPGGPSRPLDAPT